MDYESGSQDAKYVEKNPLLSHLYLSMAVYPSLTKSETEVMDALWQRSARWGRSGYVRLTYHDFVSGGVDKADAFRYKGRGHVPMYPFTGDRQFRRCLVSLSDLGLIKKNQKSYFRISAWPSDFIDDGRLLESLNIGGERGEYILVGIQRAVRSLNITTSHIEFFEKHRRRTKKRQKVHNT